ncbi:hypothetical protein QTP70_002043 [Hemibagrus guttatus]|uniref:Uncharacterized protein n=1 Tax=Hemibagrus guttatus TaxID=175788 RepID=A0AAE0QWA2_9TELE|nr:hypothetical protein QTP70_002043 [Hemibagrus guttatus]KAK3563916.1 hypothetical protein QTP86_004854 [Hemibagrus guttatus]
MLSWLTSSDSLVSVLTTGLEDCVQISFFNVCSKILDIFYQTCEVYNMSGYNDDTSRYNDALEGLGYIMQQEDMNLNEDRKAPLREKDLSTKREMVVQYISATAKSVFFMSIFCNPTQLFHYICLAMVYDL